MCSLDVGYITGMSYCDLHGIVLQANTDKYISNLVVEPECNLPFRTACAPNSHGFLSP